MWRDKNRMVSVGKAWSTLLPSKMLLLPYEVIKVEPGTSVAVAFRHFE